MHYVYEVVVEWHTTIVNQVIEWYSPTVGPYPVFCPFPFDRNEWWMVWMAKSIGNMIKSVDGKRSEWSIQVKGKENFCSSQFEWTSQKLWTILNINSNINNKERKENLCQWQIRFFASPNANNQHTNDCQFANFGPWHKTLKSFSIQLDSSVTDSVHTHYTQHTLLQDSSWYATYYLCQKCIINTFIIQWLIQPDTHSRVATREKLDIISKVCVALIGLKNAIQPFIHAFHSSIRSIIFTCISTTSATSYIHTVKMMQRTQNGGKSQRDVERKRLKKKKELTKINIA